MTDDGGATRRQTLLDLQAALLALDMHGRLIDRGETAPGDTWTSVLFGAIETVWARFDSLLTEWPAGLARIPTWLGPQRGPDGADTALGGIALVRRRLAAAANHWQPIAEALASAPDLLSEIDRWWTVPEQGETEGLRPLDAPVTDDDQLHVWVPVVHKASGQGMLIDVVVVPDAPRDVGVAEVHHDLRGVQASFVKGLQAGLSGALDRGREVGVEGDVLEHWSCLRVVELNGLPGTGELSDMSAGLPLAVALLRHFLQLPAPNQLVSGPINSDGVVEQTLDQEQYDKKSAAVVRFGARLVRYPARTDLLAIGSALWGDAWSRAVRRCAAHYLRTHDHQTALLEDFFEGLAPTVNGKPVRLVRLGLVDDILQRLSSGAQAVVVGGSRATSRTVSTRQAAFTWQEENNCPVLELRCADGRLPDQSMLAQLIDLARLAHGVPDTRRALVLLEDLLPYDGCTDLDEVLPPTARDTGTVIVAICAYAGAGTWIAERIATAPSIRRAEDVKEFCDKLLAVNQVHDLRRSTVALARQTAAGDLSFLTSELLDQSKVFADDRAGSTIAVSAAANATAEDTPIGVLESNRVARRRRAYARRLLAPLSEAKRAELRIVASCSLLHVSVPEELLQELTRTDLLRANARRDWLNRWSLANPSASRAVLSKDSNANYGDRQWKRASDAQFDSLSAFFERPAVLQTRPGVALVVATLSAAATLEARLHYRLFRKVKSALTESLTTGALSSSLPPVLIARTLVVGGNRFDEDDRVSLLRTLVRSIQAVTWSGLQLQDVAMCLRALRAHRDYFVPVRSTNRRPGEENPFVVYQDLLSTVEGQLGRRLAHGDPDHAILVVREMGQFYEDVTSKQILPLIRATTANCRRRRQRHYEAAVKLVDLALRYGARGRRDADVLAELARSPGIQELLEGSPPPDAGLLLAHAALTRAIYRGQDEAYTRQVVGDLKAQINQADPRRVTPGLALLAKVDLWFARQVVRGTDLKPWLRGTLATATPWDAAFVLRTVAQMDVRTVTDVLYQRDGLDADAPLLQTMANAIIDMGDLKGGGYVLSAVAFADNIWGPSGATSASSQMCQALEEFIDEGLSTELRGSVVLALMTALIEAGCPAETLRGLIERCAEVVRQEIEDNEKDNASRLALLLGAHEEIGREFLDLVAARLPEEVLFRRMTQAASVEARASFHRLARALGRVRDNALTDKYMDEEWWTSAVGDLGRGDALAALKAASAYLATARDAGTVHVAKDVLGNEPDQPDQWAARLSRLEHPGKLAEALDLLRKLSPDFARRCLSALDRQRRSASRGGRSVVTRRLPVAPALNLPAAAVPSPSRIDKLRQLRAAEEKRLMEGVMKIVGREFIKPIQAVDLLYAVDKIEIGAGSAIGAAMSDLDSWPNRVYSVADIENPIQLGQTLRKLAWLKLELPDRAFSHIRRRWEPMVGLLRSPAAVEELIRGYAASTSRDGDVTRQLIDRLDLQKVGLRLLRGNAKDLRFAATLLRTLAVWGEPQQVNLISASIPLNAMTMLSPGDAADLLHTIADVAPLEVPRYLPSACETLVAHIGRTKLVEPESHWLGVGWLLRELADLGVVVRDVVDPAQAFEQVAACTRDEVVRSWVAAALGAPHHLEIEEALARSAALRPWELVALALCVAEAGTDCPEIFGQPGLVRAVEFISPAWQIRLLRSARAHPELRAVLVADLDYLASMGRWLVDVGDPLGATLTRSADNLR